MMAMPPDLAASAPALDACKNLRRVTRAMLPPPPSRFVVRSSFAKSRWIPPPRQALRDVAPAIGLMRGSTATSAGGQSVRSPQAGRCGVGDPLAALERLGGWISAPDGNAP